MSYMATNYRPVCRPIVAYNKPTYITGKRCIFSVDNNRYMYYVTRVLFVSCVLMFHFRFASAIDMSVLNENALLLNIQSF